MAPRLVDDLGLLAGVLLVVGLYGLWDATRGPRDFCAAVTAAAMAYLRQNTVFDAGASGTFTVSQSSAPRLQVLADGTVAITAASGRNITLSTSGGGAVDTTGGASYETLTLPLDTSTVSTAVFTEDAGGIVVFAHAAGNGSTGCDAAAVFVAAKATAAAAAGIANRLASKAGAKGEQLVLTWPDGGTGLRLALDSDVSGGAAYNRSTSSLYIRVLKLGASENLLLPLDTTVVATTTFAKNLGAALVLAHGKGNGTGGSDAAAVFAVAKVSGSNGIANRLASKAGAQGEQLVATWVNGDNAMKFATSTNVAAAYTATHSMLAVQISDASAGAYEYVTMPLNTTTAATVAFTADSGAVLVHAQGLGDGTNGSNAEAVFMASKSALAAASGIVARVASKVGAQGEQLVLTWPDGAGLAVATSSNVAAGYGQSYSPVALRVTYI